MIEVSGAQVEQARPVAHAFSPARLTLARQVAGRTKRQLAEAIDKTAAAVTQFELGQARPSAETLACCAQALDLPVTFFAAGRPQLVVDTGMAHFRSLRATRAYQREQAMGLIALLWEVVEVVEQVVELPPVCLPGISDFARFGSPAEAARELRRFWDVSDGPLPHLVRHAEANGVVTCVLPRTLTGETAAGSPEHPSGVSNVDAFSTRVSQRSLIGLTGAKGGLLRRRFNVAHELGHLLLHPEARPGDHLHEREAHLFAAEFLMPEASIVQELPARPDPGRLLPLQRRWGASVSALAFRGRTLGRYTEPQLKRLMITLSQLGWRTNEPEDQSLLEGEEPALLRQALELASSAGMSVSSLADQLNLPPSLVRTFLGIPDSKPRLTLLKKPLPAGRAAVVCSTLIREYQDACIRVTGCARYRRLSFVPLVGGLEILIPRLNRSNPIIKGQPEWPGWPQPGQRSTGALFEARPSLRRLVVLADAELLTQPGDATMNREVLLTGLLTHPYIELLRYRDEGPPPDAPRREYGPPVARQSAAEGWAELQAPDGSDVRGLVYAASSGVAYTGIWGNRTEVARRDTSPVYGDLAPGEAANRRERDALALGVAEAVHADLFITERPYLFTTRPHAQGTTVCMLPEALSLVGLYLRSQQAFVIWRGADGSGSFNMNEGLYYWVGARELLPTAWRWFTACVQQSNTTGDRTLLDLGESLLRRVQRALEARDRFHRAFNLPQNNDTARAVLSELDSILLSLMGAADASARVAHLVLSIAGNSRNAGWQNDRQWLPRVAAAEPALAALFNAGTAHNHLMTVLRFMRNTVHGQMIRSIALQQPGRMLETAIMLPADDEAAILSSMDALGGRGSWGASAAANRWSVDPGVFIEQLLPKVLTMLNEIMDTTPVERLSHVHISGADGQPPARNPNAGEMDTFGERTRLSIRWQLGFSG